MALEPDQTALLSPQAHAIDQPTGMPPADLLSERDIARAASDARAAQVPLAQWLMSHGATRADTESSLAAHYGFPFFRFDESTSFPENLRNQLRPEFLREIWALRTDADRLGIPLSIIRMSLNVLLGFARRCCWMSRVAWST